MIFPIFIDANVPIYAAGRDHPLKVPCQAVMRLIGERTARFVTSAEVLQELLHRYHAIRAWEIGRPVMAEFSAVLRGRVVAVEQHHVEMAADLLSAYDGLSARDAVHIAVMRDAGLDTVVTADRKFDLVPGITRLDPIGVSGWGADLR